MQHEPVEYLELEMLVELEDEMDVLEAILPCPIHDADYRSDLPNMLVDEPEEMAQLAGNFDLMIKILEEADSIENIDSVVAQLNVEVRECYESNMKTVYEQTKPYEKNIRALQLLYENADGKAEVYLLPVKKEKFADAASPKHFNLMQEYLEKQFYKFKMDNSPFYITYIGDIGSKSAIQKMAKVALKTRALAVLDIKEMSSAKAVMDYSKRIGLTGIPASLGHVVIPATWAYKKGAEEIKYYTDASGKLKSEKQKMTIPLAGAFIGRLLGENPGVFITGLEAEPIVGIDGVKMKYSKERIDAKSLDECGLNMVLDSGHIQGSTTTNKSNNADLRKFTKVDVANALLKDLVQFCNNKAYGKWGNKQKRAFKNEITIYLNGRYKAELIDNGWNINHIQYDKAEEVVDIDITIPFFEVADDFNISLGGPKGGIDVQNKGE